MDGLRFRVKSYVIPRHIVGSPHSLSEVSRKLYWMWHLKITSRFFAIWGSIMGLMRFVFISCAAQYIYGRTLFAEEVNCIYVFVKFMLSLVDNLIFLKYTV